MLSENLMPFTPRAIIHGTIIISFGRIVKNVNNTPLKPIM